MNLLILNPQADECEKILTPKFPDLNIFATKREDELGDFIENADIMLAMRVSDDIVRRA